VPGIGIICGLHSESSCLDAIPADIRPHIRCAGPGPGRARIAANTLISEGCRGLISFGLAGGLDKNLQPGALVVADGVISPDGRRWPVDAAWLSGFQRATEGNLDATVAPIAGSDTAVTSRREKAELRERSGAAAVDMESHAVAEACDGAGVSFLALRAVADPLGRTVPGWVMDGLGQNGRINLSAMIAGVALHVWDIPGLISLAADSRKAQGTLRRVAVHAGPAFGFGKF